MAVKRDDKTKTWFARVSYKSGKSYKNKSKYGFKRKKDAEMWETKTKEQLKYGEAVNQDVSFADYFLKWYEVYKSEKIADSTSANYKATHTKIAEHFKNRPFNSIRMIEYQEFLNKHAKLLAIGTVRKTHKQIRACVTDALHEGNIKKDFTYKAEISGLEGKSEESKYLSHGDTKKLIEALNDEKDDISLTRRMALLAVATGMRFSEVAGLTFDRLNFETNTIKVDRTWNSRKGIFKPTKNELNRSFTVESSIMQELRQFSIEQKKKELSSSMTNPNKLLFAQYDGTPPTNDAANKSLKRACKRAGVQVITFHSLRHIFVSIHLYKGMELTTIAKRVGHKSAKTTADFYAHIIEEMENKSDELSNSIIKELFS